MTCVVIACTAECASTHILALELRKRNFGYIYDRPAPRGAIPPLRHQHVAEACYSRITSSCSATSATSDATSLRETILVRRGTDCRDRSTPVVDISSDDPCTGE